MAEDEQVVVANAIEHPLSGFQRLHHDGGAASGRRRRTLRGRTVVGDHSSRAERRGADVGSFELHSQRFHQADCGDLRRRIDTGQHAGHDSAHGRRRNDVCALAMGFEVRQACQHAVVDGGEIDGDRVVPIFGLGLARLGESLCACVVDQQMQVAELARDFLEQPGPPVAIGNVMFDGVDPCVAGLEERHCLGEPRLVAIADHDFHAGIRASPRDPETDTVGGGGNVGRLAGDLLQRGRLSNRRRRRHPWLCAHATRSCQHGQGPCAERHPFQEAPPLRCADLSLLCARRLPVRSGHV